jgi:hypothetical protein
VWVMKDSWKGPYNIKAMVHHCMSVGTYLGWQWREEAAFKRYVTYPSLVSKLNI